MSTYEEMRAKMIKQTRREILTTLAIEFSGENMNYRTICSALAHLVHAPDQSFGSQDRQVRDHAIATAQINLQRPPPIGGIAHGNGARMQQRSVEPP